MVLTLANFAEVLIMWFVPNLFFGWKIGGGGKPQTYLKGSGTYVSSLVAFGGTIVWLVLVNQILYPIISIMVERYFASLDPNDNAIVLLAMPLIAYVVFKQRQLT